jgi:hypothetical protein
MTIDQPADSHLRTAMATPSGPNNREKVMRFLACPISLAD